ncbi:MAG: ribosome maturation factor RimP [Pseudomonadota bacterium]|jgi:ribosome maturation factor RimP
MSGKESRLSELLAPTVESLGFELWGLELLSPNRRPTLRLYIEGENGVTVDNCALVSRHVSSVLDVEDPIQGEYTLEVSSPGVDRLLFKPSQYALYVGEPIEIKLRFPFEGRRKFRGWLVGLEDEDVVVRVDDNEYLLPLKQVDRARVEPRLDMKPKSGENAASAGDGDVAQS